MWPIPRLTFPSWRARKVRPEGEKTMATKKTAELPEHITYGLAESDLGSILVASSAKGVVAVLIGRKERELISDLRRRFPDADVSPGDAKDKKLARKVAAQVEKPKGTLDLPLDLRGTPFQQKVWRALLAV